jgi:putative peptide zinc metalloprotease protein
LAIYGLSFIVFMILLLGVIFYMVGVASQRYFSTTGIVVVGSFLVFFAYKIYSRAKQKDAPRGQGREFTGGAGGPGQGMRQRRPGNIQAGRGEVIKTPRKKAKSKKSRWVKLIVLGVFTGVMFLPYSYEAGGQLLIRPVDSQEISTDFTGIIEEVYFDGGETLEPGVLLAKLNSADAARQVTIHDARIKEQQAEIDRLLAKPTQEEIDLAEEALRVEQTKAEFSRMNLARKEKVFERNVISQEEMEAARREHEVDMGNVREAEANVALVKAGATEEEILAAEAELLRWQEERNLYQDKYEKSFLYMPIRGKLITQHLKQRIGQYLNTGEVFAVVENTSQVLGEVEVPEFDVGVIQLGAEVRVRVWAYHDQIFMGKVTSIDTNVEQRSFGNVVKVITLLENEDQRLKSGMTGYAKVSGETRPVWEVLFLTIVRFVQVEMWSWVP